MDYKILFVSAYFEADGTANYTMPFIDRQMESLKQAGLYVVPFSLEIYKSKLNYFKMAASIKQRVANENISIIHGHYLYSAIPCLFSKSTPIVLSLMGTDVLGEVGNTFKTKIKNIFSRVLLSILLSHCDAVIVKSNEMRKKIRHPNIHVIPNGIDFNLFFPMDMMSAKKSLRLNIDRNIILFAGNPENPRKNYQLASQVHKQVLIKQNNVDLIPLKNIPHNKIPFYLNAASCLLLTSINEGSPNILKEALACNTPVVSVNVGDAAERLQGLDMCSVSGFDVSDLAENICRILESSKRPNLRDRIGYLDNRLIAKRINRLYQTLLQPGKN